MVESAGNLIVHDFGDLAAASRALAARIVEWGRDAADRSGFFTLVLAGGRTPKLLYGLLGSEFKAMTPWDKTVVFWGDERAVPPDHPDSNFRMARETLLSRLDLPPSHIHRIKGEVSPPGRAAEDYEADIRQFLAADGQAEGRTFDLVLLGLGPDGHTASLFPGSPVLEERERWVRASVAPDAFAVRDRVTLTLSAINAAERVSFLAARPGKEEALDDILGPDGARSSRPAALVRARRETAWFVAAKE